MIRSLYAGVSGLQNHQLRTDVIGNNIANINTNGFKKGRVNFQDMIAQTLQGASKASSNRGGTNPKQVGLGMQIASIDTLMNQGSLQTTGKKTDLAIQGEGFFVLKDGDNTLYTRAGNYSIDHEGFLVNPSNGLKLQGWNSIRDNMNNVYTNTSASYDTIRIPVGEKVPAKSTSEIKYQCNLDSRLEQVQNPSAVTKDELRSGQVHMSSMDVYDLQGNVHSIEIAFVRVGVNEWEMKAKVPDSAGAKVMFDIGPLGNVDKNSEGRDSIRVRFDDKGSPLAIQEGVPNGDSITEGNLSVNLMFYVDNGTVESNAGKDELLGYAQNVRLDLGKVGGFSGVTQMSSDSTMKGISQDGYGLGYLESFTIDQSGVVTGVYSNGQTESLAQVALASFTNSAGLEKVGDTNYRISNNSGIANVGEANSQGRGAIVTGVLEMSNVDLSEEFTNMIVTQRGFQANSRIITTSDQMLQELLNLKR